MAPCVLAILRLGTQCTEITLWGWKLERGAVNLELTSTWTRGDDKLLIPCVISLYGIS